MFLFVFIILDIYANVNIDYKWSRLYILTFTVWTLAMCRIETAYIHKKLDAHYFNINANEESEINEDNANLTTYSIIDVDYPRLSLHQGLGCDDLKHEGEESMFSAEQDMMKFIQKQSGFELFMEYLNKECALEVGLMIVESTFYLNQWAKIEFDEYEIYPMINECIDNMYTEHIISKDLISLVSEYYAKLYHDKAVFDLDIFPFLEPPHFKTQKENWDYIMNKYIYNESSNYVISRNVYMDILALMLDADVYQNKQKCWQIMQNLRQHQINRATSFWMRFRKSKEYQKYHKMNYTLEITTM